MLPGEEIRKFAIYVGGLPDDGVVHADSKYFEEDVGGVDAMIISARTARTLEFWSNRCLVFIIESVFEDEAEGAALSHQKQSDARGDIKKLNDMSGYSPSIRLRSRHTVL